MSFSNFPTAEIISRLRNHIVCLNDLTRIADLDLKGGRRRLHQTILI